MRQLLAPALMLAGAIALAPGASANADSPHARATAQEEDTGTPLHQVSDGLYSAGQPRPDEWSDIRARGVATVINLRPAAEMEGRDEAAEVAAAGMQYRQLDVAGPQGITEANAAQVQSWIDEAPGPVLVHCASGNRSGTLLALIAAQNGMPAGEAIELGRRGGMTSLEAPLREKLGLPDREP